MGYKEFTGSTVECTSCHCTVPVSALVEHSAWHATLERAGLDTASSDRKTLELVARARTESEEIARHVEESRRTRARALRVLRRAGFRV